MPDAPSQEPAWQRYLDQSLDRAIDRVSWDGKSLHIVCRFHCRECDEVASFIELVPPGALPSLWDTWHETYLRFDTDLQATYLKWHDEARWRLLFEGICRGMGLGQDVDPERVDRLRSALTGPATLRKIRQFGFYDDAGVCGPCGVAYCYEHWSVSSSNYGTCPEGHGKSLDHWSPDD
jgi:hypothetical protein